MNAISSSVMIPCQPKSKFLSLPTLSLLLAGILSFQVFAASNGTITYTVGTTLMRIDAQAGATPVNLSAALNPVATVTSGADVGPVTVSSDAGWYVFRSTRFDNNIDGFAALCIAPSSLASVETVRVNGTAVHGEGLAQAIAGGSAIVFTDGGDLSTKHMRDIYIVRRNTSGSGWTTPLCLTTASPFAFNAWAVLAADGSRLCFQASNTDQYGSAGTSIAQVKLDGTGFTVLVKPSDAPAGVTVPANAYCSFPGPAPDGSIVFESIWGDGTERVWRKPVSGPPVQLPGNNNNSPVVLPNGDVVSLVLPGSTHQVQFVNPDGSSPTLVTLGSVDVADIGMGTASSAAVTPPPPPAPAPLITSASTVTFTVASSGTFTVTATGTPAPALTESGALPQGVTFVDNKNGTATLSGTPAAGSAGSYALALTANNGVSPNATQTLTLTVSSSSGSGSTPLAISKVLIKLNFAASGKDSIVFSGTVPIPDSFQANGQAVQVNVGGVRQTFSLNAKGSAQSGPDSVKIAIKSKRGVVSAQTATYTVSLKSGSFGSTLADSSNLNNADVGGESRTVDFMLVLDSTVTDTGRDVIYTAKSGKSGTAK